MIRDWRGNSIEARTRLRTLRAHQTFAHSRNTFSYPKKDSRVDKNRAIKRSATCIPAICARVLYESSLRAGDVDWPFQIACGRRGTERKYDGRSGPAGFGSLLASNKWSLLYIRPLLYAASCKARLLHWLRVPRNGVKLFRELPAVLRSIIVRDRLRWALRSRRALFLPARLRFARLSRGSSFRLIPRR